MNRHHIYNIHGDDQVLFYNVPNKVSLIVEGVNCDDLRFESTNSFKVSRERCTVTVTPIKPVDDYFFYLPFQYKKKLDTLNFLINECPAPRVFIREFFNCHGNSISKLRFRQLDLKTNDVCKALEHRIVSFEVSYKRRDSVWYTASNLGNKLTLADKDTMFYNFTPEDTILITNVVTIGNDSILRYPKDTRYHVGR